MRKLEPKSRTSAKTEARGRHRRGPLTGRFVSSKAPAPVIWYSRLELDFLRVMEVNPEVTAITRGRDLPVSADKPARKSAPNFELRLSGHDALVAIESRRFPSRDCPGCRAIAEHARGESRAFYFLERAEIRRQPRLENATRILCARGTAPSPQFLELVRLRWGNGSFSLAELDLAPPQMRSAQREIFAMWLAGHLACDIDSPITQHTKFFPTETRR